jgi:poly(3-hydroxybutyrate) depolymerase
MSALACGCSTNNEGNVISSPPPLSQLQLHPSSGGSGGSVLPTEDAGGADSAGPRDPNSVWPSTGCGKPLPPEQAETIPGSRVGYTEWHVQQTGATLAENKPANAGDRQFFVRVPSDYDPNLPYRVVYIGHGCGTVHGGKTSTDLFFDESRGGTEQAVYVGLSVPDNAANPGCYDNNSGPVSQEWEAFDLIHTFVEKTYCVDNNRIFVTGYSTGGWLANMWSCYFGGTGALDDADVAAGLTERKFAPKWPVRGGARMTGSLPPNQPTPCNGPSAGIWIHDALDRTNLLATNIAALNLALQTNGCEGSYEEGPKEPWAPAEQIEGLRGVCQQYTGCPAEVSQNYPLVFCTTNAFGHADQASAIPAFTKFFDMMNPRP